MTTEEMRRVCVMAMSKINVWRCDGCGLMRPDLELGMTACKCGAGRWSVLSLAAALKASDERARKAEELAAANVAANKRIVELEHERDKWMRRAEGWESEAAIASERYNRLAAAQPGEPLDMDCGDSSCAFAKTRSGMRTNGGCRCLENLGFCRGQTDSLRRMAAEIMSLRKRLSDLTTPRPIAEAPRDGRSVLVCWGVGRKGCLWTPEVMHWDDDRAKWMRGAESVPWAQQPTHYLPLPAEGGQR